MTGPSNGLSAQPMSMIPCFFEPMAFRQRLPGGRATWRSQMAAIARLLSRASGTDEPVDTLKIIALFSGVGLFLSLLFASYGLDLSAGFF